MAQGRCIVCKAPGRRVVLLGKRTGPVVCSRHERSVRLGATVAGAAAKAGIVAGLETARPGLYENIAKVYWAVREVVADSRDK